MKKSILIISLLISVLFTSVVYSSFNTSLQVSGEAVVRSIQNIRIDDVRLTNHTGMSYETYSSKYTKDTTSMFVTLPANTSMTYEVDITNNNSGDYLIESIEVLSNTNSNVVVTKTLNINDFINGNSVKTFTITITNNTESTEEETLVYKYGFRENLFTVTFDANGGSVGQSSKQVSYGSTYGALPTPTREGYTFKGWNGKNLFDLSKVNILQNKITISENKISFDGSETSNNNLSGLRFAKYNTVSNRVDLCEYATSVASHSCSFIKDGNYLGFELRANTNRYDPVVTFFPDLVNGEDYTLSYVINDYSVSPAKMSISNIQLEEGSVVTQYEPYYITSSTNVVQTTDHTLTAIWERTQWDYSYNGNVQEFTAPRTGTYKMELWGAQGGGSTDYPGAKGGYTSGDIVLNKGDKVFVFVGEHGDFVEGRNGGDASFVFTNKIFNNGAQTRFNYYNAERRGYGYAGGGATDIRLTTGEWNNFDSLKSRIMVAGAGGGANTYWEVLSANGDGGGLTGYTGRSNSNSHYSIGGSQISGGDYNGSKNGFGVVSYVTGTSNGGSGYYTGGPGAHAAGVVGTGGGGSSFISGYSGCNAISSSSTSDNIIHTDQPNHYSGKVFTNGVMIDGAGCNWSSGIASNCGANQPQPNGTTAIGHSGNGYARITYIETKDFDYTGDVQTYIVPYTGTYKIETWGASGGSNVNSIGGNGGYTSGNINLEIGTVLYFYVGEGGQMQTAVNAAYLPATYNGGGGSAANSGGRLGSGGGATDVRLVSGNWKNFESLKSRIIVAGGGASGYDYYTYGENSWANGASAGGLNGYDGIIFKASSSKYVDHIPPYGGAQTINLSTSFPSQKGQFGYSPNPTGSSSGGGGGYYGGYGGIDAGYSPSGGGGGSSFISGYSGCNAISESSTSTNIIHTNQPNHYSGKVFTNGVMIDGAGCNWSSGSAANCGVNQPQPDGTTATGHSGNGYAKITYVG